MLAATIGAVTSTDRVPAQANTGDEPQAVLTDVWQADGGGDPDAGLSNAKVCRNARHFTFEGFADGDEDIATSWRRLLEREGKSSPDGGSLRDLVLGPTSEAEPRARAARERSEQERGAQGEAVARAARERSEQERETTGTAARSHTQPRVLSRD